MLAQTTTTPTSSGAGGALAILLVFYLALVVVMIVAWVKILQKAGYSGAWVLVGLIPLVNMIMFLVFAFSHWPVLDQYGTPASAADWRYQGPGALPPGYAPRGDSTPPATPRAPVDPTLPRYPGYRGPGYDTPPDARQDPPNPA